MSKSFKTYLEESQKSYLYRIRTTISLDDTAMESIERALHPYHLQDITSPEQVDDKITLEFQDIPNANISCIEVSLGCPASSYMLAQELRSALNIPEKLIIVRGINEPTEIEGTKRHLLSQLDKTIKDKANQAPAALLSTDRFYLDAEQPIQKDVYGDKYNKKFLDFLADVSAKRKSSEFEAQSGLISNKDLKSVSREPSQDVADFNNEFDTPKPVMPSKGKDKVPAAVSSKGNFTDENKTYFKLTRNKNNKLIQNTISSAPTSRKRT